MPNFSRRQFATLLVIGIADFCNAICVSLQAPFYPQVAQKKGCSATEFGLVFGIFEFVVFLISPVYGRHINKIGPKRMFNAGIYTIGICAILFGLLDNIQGRYTFITASFIIRIIEAMGNAAFLTASFAIIAKEFPEHVATTFACLETCFGMGLIIGPTVGGALFQAGGYTLPFAVMGTTLLLAAILTLFVLPNHDRSDDEIHPQKMIRALKIPGIFLAALSVVITSLSIGFLQATLEPHLRDFKLSNVIVGVMFVINGAVYATSAPLFGYCCDKLQINPKKITIVGCAFVALGFAFIGPIPFFPYQKNIWSITVGLVLHGIGMGAQLVASFSDALATSFTHGFPNNIDTYGIIIALWTSSFALGAFIGPSLSGILFDAITFPYASLVVIIIHIVVGIIISVYLVNRKPRPFYTEVKDNGWVSIDEVKNGPTMTFQQTILTDSLKGVPRMENGIRIEKSRPPCMNSLIACNSYKSQVWSQSDPSNLSIGPYSYSYGATVNQQTTNGITSSSYFN